MRTLGQIARDALNDATLKGNARTWSTPYLHALTYCETIADTYGDDRADMVTAYALSNLSHWRGESARNVKAELRAHLDGRARP